MLEQRDDQARVFIATEIRMGQDRGQCRTDIDPDLKAVEIVAFFIGQETQSLRNKLVVDVERVVASFVRALGHDLTRTDAERLGR